jgi:hypothetical protein
MRDADTNKQTLSAEHTHKLLIRLNWQLMKLDWPAQACLVFGNAHIWLNACCISTRWKTAETEARNTTDNRSAAAAPAAAAAAMLWLCS